ncbi:MAG: arginine deiminase family protein [Bacteroidales bacterium]|nr:arginine deiminase family protein [Bacteroidales bacterium]
MLNVDVSSEIGQLEGVILHKPGIEIEQMVPQTIEACLYSDLLNLKIAQKEYYYFQEVLSKWTTTYQINDILTEILKDTTIKLSLVNEVLEKENKRNLSEELLSIEASELSKILIEGRENMLDPLYNLFFTRDASSSLYNQVLIHTMQHEVRSRESIIMNYIFKYYFKAETISTLSHSSEANTEGGDVLVARHDVLLLGQGMRSNKKGLEFLINHFSQRKTKFNILVQSLPFCPESFIHLDMVFTMLAKDKCMTYEPLIVKNKNNFEVTHIEIDNGRVSFHQKPNFMQGLKDLGFDLEPIKCGGDNPLYQDREQWHSGANFFSLGEGKIIGYSRNTNTIDALNKSGFEVLKAEDICNNKVNMKDYNRFVVTIDAAELPRGGGGARCMTMPIKRTRVDW